MELNDLIVIGSGAQADEHAFEKLFAEWYRPLRAYASSVLRDETLAAEAVQAVFCRLWERRELLRVQSSVKAYLYGCVYHECVNGMRREKRRDAFRSGWMKRFGAEGSRSAGLASDKVEAGELERRFRQALDELPDRCRAIFQLSRFGDLKYREIAGQLGISEKTVEAQMGKALKVLRRKLADFLE